MAQRMKVAARYIWGKTDKGYGWKPWEGCGLAIEKHGQTGHYGIYETNGTLLALCVNYRSAQRVVARIRRLTRAQVTPNAIPQVGLLKEAKTGWVFNMIDNYEDFGEPFASKAEAEAYIQGKPHKTTSPLLRSILDSSPLH
jgi:hypothetical protein